jgi:AcrR family transcriptional regulator
MSNTRTGSGTSGGAPPKSASGRRGEKPATGRQGEKVAPVKASKASKASKTSRATSPKPPSNRAERTAERRAAIIEAALDEFISRGFTATRIDDVARRAGVAKGTIYLHFKDKESMFEELIRTALVPLIGRLHAPPPSGGSVRDAVEAFARTFIQEVASTRRGDIVRLIVAEGPRFPSIADFYYREVVSRGLAGMRALIELAVSRGEIQQKNLARFPQILVAPAIIAVIWQSLFSRHAPLDATEMFRVHLDLIFGERRTT